MEHGDGSHEKEANVLTEHAAGKLLAAHPAPHLTVHDSESAMLITAAAAAVSMRLHVKEANVLHRHAAVGPLAVHPAAQFAMPDSEAAIHITPAATAVSMSPTHKGQGVWGRIARECCPRSESPSCGGAAGRSSCAPHGA